MRLQLRYHSAIPNWVKLIGLKIRSVPECEGGGFMIDREQGEEIWRAVSDEREKGFVVADGQTRNPEIPKASDAGEYAVRAVTSLDYKTGVEQCIAIVQREIVRAEEILAVPNLLETPKREIKSWCAGVYFSKKKMEKLLRDIDPEALTIADYEQAFQSHRDLVRQIDVIINGEAGAAKQASLCDLVGQIEELVHIRDSAATGQDNRPAEEIVGEASRP